MRVRALSPCVPHTCTENKNKIKTHQDDGLFGGDSMDGEEEEDYVSPIDDVDEQVPLIPT
jgi:hypothetical protein